MKIYYPELDNNFISLLPHKYKRLLFKIQSQSWRMHPTYWGPMSNSHTWVISEFYFPACNS